MSQLKFKGRLTFKIQLQSRLIKLGVKNRIKLEGVTDYPYKPLSKEGLAKAKK